MLTIHFLQLKQKDNKVHLDLISTLLPRGLTTDAATEHVAIGGVKHAVYFNYFVASVLFLFFKSNNEHK
jgi:hypothetical protein